MKVLHINSYFSTSPLFHQLHERQVASGIDISVYVPIPKNYPAERLPVIEDYTFVSRNHNAWDRLIFPIKHNKILKDIEATYNFDEFDIIHAHSLFSNGWIAYKLNEKYNIPYVVAVRNTDLRTFFEKMPWMRRLGIKILRNAEQVVFISRNSYQEALERYIPRNFRQDFINKTCIIPNGIDNYWHENRHENKSKTVHRPLRIVSTGKVMPVKRFEHLADVVDTYRNNYGPIELHIIGPVWNNRTLKNLLDRPNVFYHGSMNQDEMRNLYRRMDIFALLSYPETFGLVYPEAMSQGLPVIYTRGEGFDSFFKNKTVGVSVDRHDALEFCRAVDYIISHYDVMVDNALVGSKMFQWDEINDRYIKIYEDILGVGEDKDSTSDEELEESKETILLENDTDEASDNSDNIISFKESWN